MLFGCTPLVKKSQIWFFVEDDGWHALQHSGKLQEFLLEKEKKGKKMES